MSLQGLADLYGEALRALESKKHRAGYARSFFAKQPDGAGEYGADSYKFNSDRCNDFGYAHPNRPTYAGSWGNAQVLVPHRNCCGAVKLAPSRMGIGALNGSALRAGLYCPHA